MVDPDMARANRASTSTVQRGLACPKLHPPPPKVELQTIRPLDKINTNKDSDWQLHELLADWASLRKDKASPNAN